MDIVKLNKSNIIKVMHYIASTTIPVHLLSRGYDYTPGELGLTIDGKEVDWDMALTNPSSIPAYLLFYAGIAGINNFNADILKGIKFRVGDNYYDLSIDEESTPEEDFFVMALLQSATVCGSNVLRYDDANNSIETSGLIVMAVSTMEYLGLETNNTFTMTDIIKSRDMEKEKELGMVN